MIFNKNLDRPAMDVENFSSEYLDALTEESMRSNRQRQHKNIHQNYNDPSQRLFNAIGVDSYIRPHRHSIDPKDECLIAVRGIFVLLLFDDIGQVEEVIRFGAQINDAQQAISVGVNLPAGIWHTVFAEVPGSILFEVKSGPFSPEQAKEFAIWAPEENSTEANEYFNYLKSRVT